jgi:glycosyltransferase 2 family protein
LYRPLVPEAQVSGICRNHLVKTTDRISRRAWLAIALVALLLAGAWRQRDALASFDFSLFGQTLEKLDWRWLAGAWLFSLAAYYVRAVRWAVFLRPMHSRPDIYGLFKATTVGFAAIVLLGRPGELVRPYLIALKEKVSVASQLAAWFLERIYDLLMILLIFGFALSRVKGSGVRSGPSVLWLLSTGGMVAAAGSAGCLVGLVVLAAFHDRIREIAERMPEKIRGLAQTFVQGLECAASPRVTVEIFAYSILEWGLIAACFGSMIQAFDSLRAMGWVEVLVFMGFVAFGSLVQIPGIGGGVQVVTVFVLRELYGVPLEVASSAGLVVWIITFVGVVPVGLWHAVQEGLDWKKLKAVGEGQRA